MSKPFPPADAILQPEQDEGPQLSLLDVLTWLGEGKVLIAAVTTTVAIASIAFALTRPNIYTARTTLLPSTQQQGGSSAAAAALGALGNLGGLGSLGGGLAKMPDDLYVALLRSDSVQRALDKRFNLRERYRLENYEDLRAKLPTVIQIKGDKKTGMISVEVDDKDPQFAADLANAHATEIDRLLGRLAVSEAQQRRTFFEQQLKDSKDRLVRAEQTLREVQEKSGMVVLDKQAEAIITAVAQLKSRIAEREIQLKVMRATTTPENPDTRRVASELAAMRSELARMESNGGAAADPDGAGAGIDIAVGRLPSASVDYVRAMREVKFQEAMLAGMLRQFEGAKLDEAKNAPALQQVDEALPPDFKSKPRRSQIVMGATLAALLLSAAWVVVRRFLAVTGANNDPERQKSLASLRGAWRLRRR